MPTQPNVKEIENQLLEKLNKDKINEKKLTNEDVSKDNKDNEKENPDGNKEMRRKEFLRRQMNKER